MNGRYFFCHLQKTGGTSLLMRLRRHFGGRAVYPTYGDGGPVVRVMSVPHLLSTWERRGSEIALVTGHFPLCTTELLGGGFTTLTVLREPVERTLSFLRHHRRLHPADRDNTLERIYEGRKRFHAMVENHMVKMLSLGADEMTRGMLTRVEFSPERLSRAKERLAAVDAVGLQEDLEGFCGELERRFSFTLGGRVEVNQSPPTIVSDAFRARIAEENAADVELYEFARRLVASRTGAAAADAAPASTVPV